MQHMHQAALLRQQSQARMARDMAFNYFFQEVFDNNYEEILMRHAVNLIDDGPQKRQRTLGFTDVALTYPDEEFRENFRVPRSVFNLLVEKFKESDARPARGHGYGPKSAEEHILSFLWFASSTVSIQNVAFKFNMAESTFHEITTRVLEFLNTLAKTEFKMPRTEPEKITASAEFQKIAGFPECIGTIDCTYIPILHAPEKVRNKFCTPQKDIKLGLQAVCDSKMKFTDIFVGTPDMTQNWSVFASSNLAREIEILCENEKYHLIGDLSYNLRSYLITPFQSDYSLTPAQLFFTQMISTTGLRIKDAFRILKNRFRQLKRIVFTSVEKSSQFVIACCVIHNLCVDAQDSGNFNEQDPESAAEQQRIAPPPIEFDWASWQRGAMKRDLLVHRLCHTY